MELLLSIMEEIIPLPAYPTEKVVDPTSDVVIRLRAPLLPSFASNDMSELTRNELREALVRATVA